MEGEGEIITEGVCDTENSIYVAVGKNLNDGKSLLSWALKNFPGKNLCLLHVHQPSPSSVSLIGERLSVAKLKRQAAKTCQEHWKADELLNQYLHFIGQSGILSGKVWIQMSNIEKGIVRIIAQHGVRWLVMGAAAEKHYSKQLSELRSNKAIFVNEWAPISCQIWFSCKGYLINTRSLSTGSHSASTVKLCSQINKYTTVIHDQEEDSDKDIRNFQCFKLQEKVDDGATLIKDDGSLLYSLNKSQDSSHPPSVTLMESTIQAEQTLHDKLEHAMVDAESLKQKAFEASARQWRAEKDAMEAMQAAEASESLCQEEIHQIEEMEDLLVTHGQELERMKDQHDKLLKELQIIQDRKPVMERYISENCHTEKELEDKIIQAVELLIRFKERRDTLLIERDNAVKRAHYFRKLVKEYTARLCVSQSFHFSFVDIIEATQNFDPSLKMGEGRFGSVYKGIIHHTKVAIKMLPSCGSQSDMEFNHEVEVLSRVRHPNLVTLIGTCTESRSLIYEYLENKSLEDHLAGGSKTRVLSWQTRIRIASEICLALVFLHTKENCIVHGNLRPDKVLFDANFVSKISDPGIHLLVSHKDNGKDTQKSSLKNNLETDIYIDPELIEGGELSPASDIYSFGLLLLRLLTARPASTIVRDVKCATEAGNLNTVLDYSAGNWPLEVADQLAHLALRCCEEKRANRADLEIEVLPIIETMKDLCTTSCTDSSFSPCQDSKAHRRVPSHFVCPIFQEVMKDPYIAADGFTYEADAIKGWLNSGHKTSPMTNLELDHLELIPNYALYHAIQEWQQFS